MRRGDFLLRPPAWCPRDYVQASVDGKPAELEWDGPQNAYVRFPAVHPGQDLMLNWPLASFCQRISERYIQQVNGATASQADTYLEGQSYTFAWVGNVVRSVNPNGKWLPLYVAKI